MDVLSFLRGHDNDDGNGPDLWGINHPRDKIQQIILSLLIGITTFLTFCVLRLKWTNLYAARKKQKYEASVLPELPNTLFGWIPTLFRVTDQQILASAGLDAYAFLAFFKLATKFLLVTFFFSLTIIKPVHDAYPDEGHDGKHDSNATFTAFQDQPPKNGTYPWEGWDPDYLWMYVVLAYIFSAVAIYLIVTETRRIIELRQDFLGSQRSVTERTIRLSGIPSDLQDEARLRELIEALDIGKVESVTLCRKWGELDKAMRYRKATLRRLEEATTIYHGRRRVSRNLATLPISQPRPPNGRLVDVEDQDEPQESQLSPETTQPHISPTARPRPMITIRKSWWDIRGKRVDAIHHYQEKLKEIDEKIRDLRQTTFEPTPLAFVTMDSVAACQMAIQAVLDPSPEQLIAAQSPSPTDVVWENTYLPRRRRMLQSWSITVLILFLTIFWGVIFAPIALALNVEALGRISPQLKEFLRDHESIEAILTTQVPTLLLSLLIVLVPYVYYYLSWCQGMTSQGDIELSAISKNFFFTFFNFFIFFTILGTASKFYTFFKYFGDALRDFQNVARVLALSLQKLLDFYVNFVILQGVGLLPLRLLELGSVSLYPVYRMGAKTPRDYAELVQPPMFSYAFYLPNALLILIICMAYSVLRSSWQILLAGLIFFSIGHFVYKYQLLYAMDHRQQASGRAWGMICDRIFVGLVFFQVTTAGQLISQRAVTRSLLMVPLVVSTIWVAIAYSRIYKPLLRFIALRSIKRGEGYTDHDQDGESVASDPSATESTSTNRLSLERNVWADSGSERDRPRRRDRNHRARVSDEPDDAILRYVNPSLIAPLEELWIEDVIDEEQNGEVAV